ncbi:MAG: hypothetical protein ACRD1R_11530 [Acidobacteriota bacterium]
MFYRLVSWAWLIIILLFSLDLALAGLHDSFVAYFPQVVKGALGDQRTQTSIFISNPNQEIVEVTISSGPEALLPSTVLVLGPGETHEIRIAGEGDLLQGWVRLEATDIVAAVAHIMANSSSAPVESTFQLTILAQRPVSKAVILVRLAPNGQARIENTAVALAAAQIGTYLFTLRDSEGAIIASRKLTASLSNLLERDFSTHLATFVTDLFPNLPSNFSLGSLTVEYTGLEIARAFAMMAVYTRGTDFWGAEVTGIDVIAGYLVKFKPIENLQETAEEMSKQYGFTIKNFFRGAPDTAEVLMFDQVAQAVARDPRVERVSPISVFEPSGPP